jgi:hypothetical protein
MGWHVDSIEGDAKCDKNVGGLKRPVVSLSVCGEVILKRVLHK